MTRAQRNAGFTLVELLVAMTFALMFAALVLSFMINFWSAAATLQNNSDTFNVRQNAGDRLRETLNAATQLITQNSISDSHALVPDPSDPTSTHWKLIHAIPGTTNMPSSGSYTPIFYYESPTLDSSKNFILNGANPYYDEFVLYLNGSTQQLLLRTLANSSAAANRLKTTCPPSSATASCPADTVMASDIASIGLRYFSRSGNTIDYTSVVDPLGNYIGPDFPAVEVVEITLHLSVNSKIHGGESTLNETIIRVALRNG